MERIVCGPWENCRETVRSHVFAKLIEIAVPRMTDHLSDLYYDRNFIDEAIGEHGGHFVFAVRTTGTHVVTDWIPEEADVFRIDVVQDTRRWWWVGVTPYTSTKQSEAN